MIGILLCAAALVGQASIAGDLDAALAGDWVGVLEYRDYSEPATSTKRVQLPTWLHIGVAGGAETWHYVYDDGPNKTVDETATVRFDPSRASYSSAANGKPAQVFAVQGYDALKSGRGTLVLLGKGTDAGKSAELRMTLTVRRNLLEVLEEVRPAGSPEAFAYRHLYRFVRRDAPMVRDCGSHAPEACFRSVSNSTDAGLKICLRF